MIDTTEKIKAVLNRRFPQHLLFRRPWAGMLLLIVFLFLFSIIYKPVQVHATQSSGLTLTIFLYAIATAFPVIGILLFVKHFRGFPRTDKWQLNHELISLLIILVAIGIAVYFAGFIIEEPKMRWNLSTFIDSLTRSILVALIPVLLPTLFNIRYAFTPELFHQYAGSNPDYGLKEEDTKRITIRSKAKREELHFYLHELIYAESEGNYVSFYFENSRKKNRVMIRNTISDIEEQLDSYPFLMRVHRAFIVNLKLVDSKTGNRLGYRLKLKECSRMIPVSRNKTKEFDARMNSEFIAVGQ